MSDQYTRITCGGTPLAATDPVVGLLFGTFIDNHLAVADADDIPTDASEAAQRQVSLHQAVFPQHSVIGWYRVSQTDEQPSAEDLVLTKQLQQHYQTSHPLLFSLLQVPSSATDDLPLMLYRLGESSTVLEALEDWHLSTSDAERIAVERVMREQPQRSGQNAKPGAKVPVESAFIHGTEELQHSLQAIQDRLGILHTFLSDTQSGKIPFDPTLMRSVQRLLWQAGPLACAPGLPADQSTLEQLAFLTKTVDAVQSYTEKYRKVSESTAMSQPMARREQRRF